MEPEDDSEIRPLPDPPRCRGVPIGDGNYTGWAEELLVPVMR